MRRLLLICLAAVFMFGAAPADLVVIKAGGPCDVPYTGESDSEVVKGDPVTVCFEYDEAERSGVQYFRVRSSQAMAGNYGEWFRLANDSKGFTFKADRTRYLMITAVSTTKETVPDDVVRITVSQP